MFVLDVGHTIEFDWTWEGAVAFRPADVNGFNGTIDVTDDFTGSLKEQSVPANVWFGEVVEVDQANGKFFVSVSTPENPPCCGSFYVRPFEFLAFLYAVYCQPNSAPIRSWSGSSACASG